VLIAASLMHYASAPAELTIVLCLLVFAVQLRGLSLPMQSTQQYTELSTTSGDRITLVPR
jgi:hypothetical protein